MHLQHARIGAAAINKIEEAVIIVGADIFDTHAGLFLQLFQKVDQLLECILSVNLKGIDVQSRDPIRSGAEIGLRADRADELTGLDISEHGLPSAYAGFAMSPDALPEDDAPVLVDGDVPAAEAVPVKTVESGALTRPKFTKVEIICKEGRLDALKNALSAIGITGMTVSHVLGCGQQKGKPEFYRGVQVEPTLLPKVQLDVVVSKVPVSSVIAAAKKALYTGHIGDGKIFVYDVENVVKVRTGEEGYDALQDVE